MLEKWGAGEEGKEVFVESWVPLLGGDLNDLKAKGFKTGNVRGGLK